MVASVEWIGETGHGKPIGDLPIVVVQPGTKQRPINFPTNVIGHFCKDKPKANSQLDPMRRDEPEIIDDKMAGSILILVLYNGPLWVGYAAKEASRIGYTTFVEDIAITFRYPTL